MVLCRFKLQQLINCPLIGGVAKEAQSKNNARGKVRASKYYPRSKKYNNHCVSDRNQLANC
jgi:hypothetical protein